MGRDRLGLSPSDPPGRPGWSRRAGDVVLGASVLTWSALALASAPPGTAATPVRLTVALLNACVGGLLLARAPARREAPARDVVASLPALAAGGWALHVAPAPSAWPLAAEIAFACGGLIAAASLLTLGRSFAVLPAVRELVARGPYRVVRHPAYLGELLMVLGCVLAAPGAAAAATLAAALAAVTLRIRAEERLLVTGAGYGRYAERVRWRLLPGLW